MLAVEAVRGGRWVPLVLAAVLAGCGRGKGPAEPPATPRPAAGAAPPATSAPRPGESAGPTPALVDVAPALGIVRPNECGSPGLFWIFENIGSGAGFLDFDGDGLLDVFVNNAGTTEILPGPPKRVRLIDGPGTSLYRQRPDGKFEDVTERAGVRFVGWGTGVTVGDLENDGDLDLFLGAYGTNRLFVNQGDGTFQDATKEAGLDQPGYATSAAFVDFDRDGLLDLYVANYVVFDLDRPPNGGEPCLQNGVVISCGPTMHRPVPHVLWRNRGDGTFEDVTTRAGMSSQPGSYGLGVAAGDLDRDGWQDIYVTNDTQANFVWRNLGDGTFEEIGILSGAALSDSAQGQSGMGVDLGDVDGDGWLDIQVSNYSEEANAYYRNLGDGTFADESTRTGLVRQTFMYLLWGTKLCDLEHDGDLDLVVVGGHVHPRAGELAPGLHFEQRILIFENDGTGKVTDVTKGLGPAVLERRNHRGLAAGDFDRDGDLDLLVTVLDGPPLLIENRLPRKGGSVEIVLEGSRSNREGIGARIEIDAGGRKQVRSVTRGGSYLSASDAAAHFGLGAAEAVDGVEVTWPSGAVTRTGRLEEGRRYRIREADGSATKVWRFRD
jgi:enediyne biosynthesis protein E4